MHAFLGTLESLKYDFTTNLELLPIDQLLNPENINEKGFVLKESTNPNDGYSAGSLMAGGYLMIEQNLLEKLKLVGGVRFENFTQNLATTTYGGTKIDFSKQLTDILPSVNLIYAIYEQSNFRASASQTVCRPNFRELAPFLFLRFQSISSNRGRSKLSKNKNHQL